VASIRPTMVISPHLDDAVLGCGHRLATHPGSVVVTIFAGMPRDESCLTEWDARCGFSSVREAIACRRHEDSNALARLGATPVWLDYCDSQYREPPAIDAVSETLRRVLMELRPGLVLFPLGLYHSDHLLAHAASRKALAQHHGASSAAYEDALYRRMPGVLQQRLIDLAGDGMQATPAALHDAEVDSLLKRQAVQDYASQLRVLGKGALAEATLPERFWVIEGAGHVDDA
jgi:LmbE family N-acetylglucosaminyl deacetylase